MVSKSTENLSTPLPPTGAGLREVAEKDPMTRLLTTVHGVGPVTAVAFAAAIEDPKRFRNAHKASAYLGVVPGEDSSGDGKRRTSITKTGSSHVRWTMVRA
jgi:transposase